MSFKPKVYFTSNVFTPKNIGSNKKIHPTLRTKLQELWDHLNSIAIVKVFDGRFPSQRDVSNDIHEFNPDVIGCHISQPISQELIEGTNLFAVSTSTAGYNHISPSLFNNIIVTHTPGVLHETVADYTIALIMASLRNLIDLHYYVWTGNWNKQARWDLDQDLSSVITSKVIGIVGLGEIGNEIVKRLSPWGIKILYFDVNRKLELEQKYSNLTYKNDLEEVFRAADIVSLHIPLNKQTENLISTSLLKLMKPSSLLVNTARGGIIDLKTLLNLLEKGEIYINLALDVFPEEPISKSTLKRIKGIKKKNPALRMILMPHNASADADTRANMVILFLQDVIRLILSSSIDDLVDVNIIPEQKNNLRRNNWIIQSYWRRKKEEDCS